MSRTTQLFIMTTIFMAIDVFGFVHWASDEHSVLFHYEFGKDWTVTLRILFGWVKIPNGFVLTLLTLMLVLLTVHSAYRDEHPRRKHNDPLGIRAKKAGTND